MCPICTVRLFWPAERTEMAPPLSSMSVACQPPPTTLNQTFRSTRMTTLCDVSDRAHRVSIFVVPAAVRLVTQMQTQIQT